MYRISKQPNHLLVEFREDFDYPMIKTIIRHETMMKEYPRTNDIWLIGNHHANIHLGELDEMVHDFQCRCSSDASRTKTAVVVREGLTGAILELWVKALQKHVAFDIQLFRTLNEAEEWLGVAETTLVS